MTYNLPIPKMNETGAYESKSLFEYLQACREKQVSFDVMAQQLNLPKHRVIYAAGLGFERFRRAAHD